MTKPRKKRTINDIIAEFQGITSQPFEKRIAAFERLHHPEEQHQLVLQHEADYIVNGKPGEENEYKGAYNEAYRRLDSILKNDKDKLGEKDDEKIREIVESYVDEFLKRAASTEFQHILDYAEQKGFSKKKIREAKGKLFATFHTSKEGSLDPFHDEFIKQYKGKNKLEAIESLKSLGEQSKRLYPQYLLGKAGRDLIKDTEHSQMAEYVEPKFIKAGWKNPKGYFGRDAIELGGEYVGLLQGTDLKEAGFTRVRVKKDKHRQIAEQSQAHEYTGRRAA